MDAARPSLARRAIAVLVLAVVAIVAFRLVLGVISAVAWMIVLAALVVAGLWAAHTLRSVRRGSGEKRERGVAPASTRQVAAPAREDLVEAQMRQIKEQLREQGRL